jgi:hypothetical protein
MSLPSIIVVLMSMLVMLMSILAASEQVYSQMPSGFQMPKMIYDKYVNTELGLEMILPQGIQGMESNNYGATMVIITLGDPSTATIVNGINDLPLMEIIMNPPPLTKLNDTGLLTTTNSVNSSQTIHEDMGCKTVSTETTNLGGKIAQSFEKDCLVGTGAHVKVKKYTVDLGGGSNVLLSFKTPSPIKYDLNIGTFENMVKSIKFTK